MELELFVMETCDGEEEIAGNEPVVGAVSGGKEISAAVRNRKRVIQLLLELLAMERRDARLRAGNAPIARVARQRKVTCDCEKETAPVVRVV